MFVCVCPSSVPVFPYVSVYVCHRATVSKICFYTTFRGGGLLSQLHYAACGGLILQRRPVLPAAQRRACAECAADGLELGGAGPRRQWPPGAVVERAGDLCSSEQLRPPLPGAQRRVRRRTPLPAAQHRLRRRPPFPAAQRRRRPPPLPAAQRRLRRRPPLHSGLLSHTAPPAAAASSSCTTPPAAANSSPLKLSSRGLRLNSALENLVTVESEKHKINT